MDFGKMTLEEVMLQYGETTKYIGENIEMVSNEQLTNLLNQLNSLQAASVKQYDKNLEKERKSNQDILDKYNRVAKRIKLSEHSNYDVVTINVGGRTFSTFRETLMRFESTYFYALLNSGNFNPGPDGSYFIDRSPIHFELIMDYLRSGEFSKGKLKRCEMEELRKELDYYLLPMPQDLKTIEWQWDLSRSKKPVNATFSDDNWNITKSAGKEETCDCPVIGSSPVSEFTVQIISGEHITIGFCRIDQFIQNGEHFCRVKNGCFFGADDGDLWFNGGQYKPYSSQLEINDKITAIKDGTSIRFLKNGVDQGEAINNAEGEMYPVVELCYVGDSVMIVPNP
jgi:hypothetical protein